MLGRTVSSEEIGEHLENVVSSSLSTDLDRQTLPRVLVEHGQKLQRTAVMVNEGVVTDITYNSVDRYVMSETLVEYLEGSAAGDPK